MAQKKKTTKNPKLIRLEKNKVLGGVCGGVAEFFNIDPTIVRLIFILITIFGGSGILLYIILWLVIPSEKSDGEISEKNIKMGADEMKERAEEFANRAKDYPKTENSKVLVGVFVLALGVILLFQNFGIFRFFNLWRLWPIAIIVLGYLILTKRND